MQCVIEAVDSPHWSYIPLLHPLFAATVPPVRLYKVHFELQFSVHLCLWTNRSGASGDPAERSYGVLRSYNWTILGEWNIDASNNITVVTPMSVTISGGITHNPLAKPKVANCQVCPRQWGPWSDILGDNARCRTERQIFRSIDVGERVSQRLSASQRLRGGKASRTWLVTLLPAAPFDEKGLA